MLMTIQLCGGSLLLSECCILTTWGCRSWINGTCLPQKGAIARQNCNSSWRYPGGCHGEYLRYTWWRAIRKVVWTEDTALLHLRSIYLDLVVHVPSNLFNPPVSILLVPGTAPPAGAEQRTSISPHSMYTAGRFSPQALTTPRSQRYTEERQVDWGLEQRYGMRRATHDAANR